MDRKVMCDLLDRGQDGNTILRILDALTESMNETVEEEELVEATKPSKKTSKKKELVEV